jgi:Spy/CpxP family protein refolding chaperone
MITALVAGGVLTAGIAVYAQDATNTPAAPAQHAPPPAHSRIDAIAAQLALTDDQKAKAKPVIEDMYKTWSDLRKDTTLEKADRAAKMKEARDDASAKLKDILTPEQFQKWQTMGPRNRVRPATPPAGTNAPAASAPAATTDK